VNCAPGPHVAAHVLDPTLHPAFRLGPIRLTEPNVEADPQCVVQKAPVPLRSPVVVTAQYHHLGVEAQTPQRHSAKVGKAVDVTQDEAPPIDLGLLSRLSLEPDRRHRLSRLAQRVHVLLQYRVTAAVPLDPQISEKHDTDFKPI